MKLCKMGLSDVKRGLLTVLVAIVLPIGNLLTAEAQSIQVASISSQVESIEQVLAKFERDPGSRMPAEIRKCREMKDRVSEFIVKDETLDSTNLLVEFAKRATHIRSVVLEVREGVRASLLSENLSAEALSLAKEKERLLTESNESFPPVASLNGALALDQGLDPSSVTKHWDPSHPGHMHQCSRCGRTYQAYGDNYPGSPGSYGCPYCGGGSGYNPDPNPYPNPHHGGHHHHH
jgi:hypothetical protein